MSHDVTPPPRETIRYDPNAPAPLQRWVHIALPRVSKPVQAVICGSALVGVWLHWWRESQGSAGRSVPCVIPQDKCDLCAMPRMTPHWTGYVAAWQCRPIQRYCLLQLTPNAVWSCPELARPKLGTLRGLAVVLRRHGRENNSPIVAELARSPIGDDQLPDPIDEREALLRLWGYSSPVGLAWDDLHALEITPGKSADAE